MSDRFVIASSSTKPSAQQISNPFAAARGVKRRRAPVADAAILQGNEEGEVDEEGESAEEGEIVSVGKKATKRHRHRRRSGRERGRVKHVNLSFFPAVYELAEEMAEDADLSFGRQQQNRTRTVNAVPHRLQHQPHLLRTADTGFFAGKSTEEAKSQAFFIWVIICRFLDEYLLSTPLVSVGQGLLSKNWNSISKNAPWDWDSNLQQPKPSVTLEIAKQLGMARLLFPEPTVIEVPRSVFVPTPKTLASDEEMTSAIYRNLETVGNGDGYYFYLVVPDHLRPLAPERDRFKYVPRAWMKKGPGQTRSLKEFRFLLELTVEDKTCDQVIEFEVVVPTNDSLVNWRQWKYDIWSNYEHDTVYVLRTYVEREQCAAQGKRVFARPVRVMEKVNGDYIRRREKLFKTDHCNIRVWHGFDLKSKIVVPADTLEEVGSLNKTSRMQVSLEKWRAFAEQAQVVVPMQDQPVDRPLAAPAVPAPVAAPRSLRQLIADQLSVANGMYLYFDGHLLPSASGSISWPPQQFREFIVWRTGKQHWRVSLEVVDIVICDTHPGTTTQTRAERHVEIAKAWGGSGYIPVAESPLVSDDWLVRLPGVEALASIVSSWPSQLEPFPDKAREYMNIFAMYERKVFREFSQVYSDYMFRRPPMLYRRPRMPWDK